MTRTKTNAVAIVAALIALALLLAFVVPAQSQPLPVDSILASQPVAIGVGPQEILVILVIIALLFGVRQLPKMGKALGEGIREFRKAGRAITEELEETRETVDDVASAVGAKPKRRFRS